MIDRRVLPLWIAMATDFDIIIFVFAIGRIIRKLIGNGAEVLIEAFSQRRIALFQLSRPIFQSGNFQHQRSRIAALGFDRTDFFRRFIAPCQQLLHFGLYRPALLIQLEDRRRLRVQSPARPIGVIGRWIVANGF